MIMSTQQSGNSNNNNNNNDDASIPQTGQQQPQPAYEEFQELQKQQAQPASKTQPTQYDENGNAIFPQTDNLGNPNKSRGVIGVGTTSGGGKEQPTNKIQLGQPTKGTIADRVNSPINTAELNKYNNSAEGMNQRIINERRTG